MKFLENKFMPIAAKLGQQRHLAAIRDAFALIMPFIIAGAFATLLNNVVFKTDVNVKFSLFKLIAPNANGNFFTDIYIAPVMVLISQATFSIMALLVSFGLGYYLAISKKSENPIFAGMVSTVVVLMLSTWSVVANVVIESSKPVLFDPQTMQNLTPTKLSVIALDPASLGATALFATLIFGLLAAEIYTSLQKINVLKIKMPQSVPPAVSKAFSSLLPGILTLLILGIISIILTKTFNEISVFSLISKWVQEPFMSFANSKSAGILMAFVYVLFVHLLWVFGIHGTNVMNGIFAAIWQTMLVNNIEIYKQAGHNAKNLSTFAQPFFDSFVFLGGAGASIALIIAIFVFSKREDEKTIAKLSFAPGVFNINEPVIFGLPVVLNPIYLVPFIVVPVLNLFIAWFFVDIISFVPKIVALAPWTTPPVIGAFVATGFAWQAIILTLGILIIDVLIYVPFVKVSTKHYLKKQVN